MRTKTKTNQCCPSNGDSCPFYVTLTNSCKWGIGKSKFLNDPKGKIIRDCKLIKKG